MLAKTKRTLAHPIFSELWPFATDAWRFESNRPSEAAQQLNFLILRIMTVLPER
jgi:hypothetical protein